jgi:glyoxylase-like metal-dependent hydrolase (beta-lactamase superfamily II)
VYLAEDDYEWAGHKLSQEAAHLLELVPGKVGATEQIVPGVTAIKTGGHFPGSFVLHWKKCLFIADTIVTVPSGHTPHPRPSGQTTYAFLWSIPNMIPMTPDDILGIWKAIEPFEFEATYGAFQGMDVEDKDLKKRMLESMKIVVRTGGWPDHRLLSESV